MERRRFMGLFGSSVIASPLAALAQQARTVPVIGILWHAGSAQEEAAFLAPLRAGFADLGYVEGKNIIFEDRYPAEQPDRFDGFAAELAQMKVDVLIAPSIPSALALQRATAAIPIVLVANPDPVGLKLVSSLARPGGNITGLSTMAFDLAAKRVQILKEAIPSLLEFALLVNPNNSYDLGRLVAEVQPIADRLNLAVRAVAAHTPEELDGAFGSISQSNFGAVIVAQNQMYFNERKRIAEIALANRLPTMVPADLFVEAGALIGYGPSWPAIFRNAAGYVDKILRGAKPADLPVQQPTKFQLVVNLKTAKALGMEIPLEVLSRTDRLLD